MNNDYSNDNSQEFVEVERVSKSQLKREAQALLALGKKIVALSPANLKKVPLDADLQEAVVEAQAIRSNVALKRQLHYLGKLLRQREVDEIQAAVESIHQLSSKTDNTLRSCEMWRGRLIRQEQGALAEFMSKYPDVDRQRLRQMIRNAQKEATNNKPPKYSRELFRYLRSIVEG